MLCCKLMGITELNKPMHQWCPHCVKGRGCGIYESRPNECRTFNCDWLVTPALGDEWAPQRSKMILLQLTNGESDKLVVHVDPSSPLAWTKEPYYSQLKKWARSIEARDGLINVRIGKRLIVVLPNKDVDLGTFEEERTFNYKRRRVGSEWEYEFEREARDAPPPQSGKE